jgi:hypothetical protein
MAISPHAEALVGGAVAMALVELLFDKGILQRDEARAAEPRIAPGRPLRHLETHQIIGDLLSGKLSQRASGGLFFLPWVSGVDRIDHVVENLRVAFANGRSSATEAHASK